MPIYRKRIDIKFQNPDEDSDVAAFYPGDKMIIYSVREDCDRLHAKTILQMALREFAELGEVGLPINRRHKVVSFRAYLLEGTRLTITKRTRRATLAKYRSTDKFSHSGKPKGVRIDERIVRSIEIT